MVIEIQGFCDERFQSLKEAFEANFRDGYDLGASLALMHEGKPVVDLWAGYSDVVQTKPWAKDTIVCVASSTKITAFLCTMMLVDRGKIDLDERVAHYWPEFAQGGKDAVTVRDALSHQAGVPGFDVPISSAIACDWAAVTARLAAEPNWSPGKKRVFYHANTYGFLLGEIIRRVDGRKPAQFFREEIAEKIDVDYQIGLSSKAELERTAQLKIPKVVFNRDVMAGTIAGKVIQSIENDGWGTWEWSSHDDPAGNGYANGRSMAKLASILANGGEVDGVRLLSPEAVKEICTEQVYGQCPYIGWLKMGLGVGLNSKEFPAPSPTTVHWGGYGGSFWMADPATGISLGFAPNNWIIPGAEVTQFNSDIDPRWERIAATMTELLSNF